jgi:predicted methyltransferase
MKFPTRFALVALVFLTACTHSSSRGVDADSLRDALASGDRPDADKTRDAGRKPAKVVAFLGVREGNVVIDLIAAGGYYSEVLATAVGPDGHVYAQNNKFVLEFRDGANEKAISARLADDRLPNVERLDREIADLGIEPDSVDGAITALNFHDIYNGRGPEAAAAFLQAIYVVLKPGGFLGLIDHDGSAGADNDKLHRIEMKRVVELVEASPFKLEAKSNVLRNPNDDHSKNVFDPSVRGVTDRFVLLLRKPAAS